MKKLIAIYTGMTLLLASGIPHKLMAQDSLRDLRTFLTVCNSYKQLPLQLEVDIHCTTNWVSTPEDTLHVLAKFQIQEEGTYVSFGELEQLANDSLLLIVSNKLKKMILYKNNQSVAGRLRQYMGFQLRDTSALMMSRKYLTYPGMTSKDTAGIELKSRAVLAYTKLPKETIRLKYDPQTRLPFEVSQVKLNLLSLDESEYKSLAGNKEYASRLLMVSDSSLFLIREQVSTFRYTRLSHSASDRLPVKISDRIDADKGGSYQPVNAYKDYILTQNF